MSTSTRMDNPDKGETASHGAGSLGMVYLIGLSDVPLDDLADQRAQVSRMKRIQHCRVAGKPVRVRISVTLGGPRRKVEPLDLLFRREARPDA